MAEATHLSLHDPVIFSLGGRPSLGHVARKSARSAIVVTADGSEHRIPLAGLSLQEGGQRRRVGVRSATLKAKFHPGQRVSFPNGQRRRHGVVSSFGPKRALVVCDDGDEFRVPYGMLEGDVPDAGASAARLEAVAAEAERLMERHGLARWSFQFDDAPVRAGCCNYRSKVISLSHLFAARAPEAEVRDTILHEIAHALVGPEHGHDRVWKAMALSIGCSGRRCHDVQFSLPRYIVSCARCEWSRRAQRRRRRVVCRTCGGPVTYQTFTRKAWEEAPGAE